MHVLHMQINSLREGVDSVKWHTEETPYTCY